MEYRDQIRDDQSKKKQSMEREIDQQEWDNSEFQQISILPEWEEICISGPPAKLRPNNVEGCYKNWMHYYDVQFRLLREDFMAPLRRGICGYLQGLRGRELRDVKVYNQVRIHKPVFMRNGICFEIHFDVSRFQQHKWEHSKRLIFGSLLCLSCDDFRDVVLFATVANRNPDDLRQGNVQVKFEDSMVQLQILSYCKKETSFIMVESVAYFEASRHILKSLQTAEVDTMPFTQYLITGDCSLVRVPKYLGDSSAPNYVQQNVLSETSELDSVSEDSESAIVAIPSTVSKAKLVYNLSCLYGAERSAESKLSFNILDKSQWPTAEEIELDQSQLEAIQMGLTQEIAVIQGPPGTGKTYIGLKIVEALLNNRQAWDPQKASPILVMCYTNHALDQFLEGILEQKYYHEEKIEVSGARHLRHHMRRQQNTRLCLKTPKLVRIGSRSQNEKVSKYNIQEVARKTYVPRDTLRNLGYLIDEIEKSVPEIEKALQYFFNPCHRKPKVLNLSQLRYPVADPEHFYQLTQIPFSREQKGHEVEIWLQLWEDKNTAANARPTASKVVQQAPSITREDSGPKHKTKLSIPDGVVPGVPTAATNARPTASKVVQQVPSITRKASGPKHKTQQSIPDGVVPGGPTAATNARPTVHASSCEKVVQQFPSITREDSGPKHKTKLSIPDGVVPGVPTAATNARPTASKVVQQVPSITRKASGPKHKTQQSIPDGVVPGGPTAATNAHPTVHASSCEKVVQQFPSITREDSGPKHKTKLSIPDGVVPGEPTAASENSNYEQSEEDLVDVQGDAATEEQARMLSEDVENFKPIVSISVDSISDEDGKDEPSDHCQYEGGNDEGTVQPQNPPDVADEEEESDVESDSEESETESDEEMSQPKPKPKHTCKPTPRPKPRLQRRKDADHLIRKSFYRSFMSEEEASQVEDIMTLSLYDRWRLYNYWARRRCENENAQNFERYTMLCQECEEARLEKNRCALEAADVIGMTTTGAAKYQHILHFVKPKIVIVEEAAEVLESHIVSALSAGTQHLILIGDHKQLKPKPNEYDLAKKFKLDVSLFERLVTRNFPHTTLQIQHRMRPEIARLVCPHIYKTLINHESVLQYRNVHVKGVSKDLFFIQHDSPESEDANLMSHSNKHEANFIVALCSYLLQQGYKPDQITVLTPYVGQLLKIRNLMPRKSFEGVRITAVDNFQGEENDIILLSLVRSNAQGKLGFLREENRVCVSLSRAKIGLYCIGNFKMLSQNSYLWETIMSDMEQKGYLGDALPLQCYNHPKTTFEAKRPADFDKFAPTGGCLAPCEYRLHCGHVCTRLCHPEDPEHKQYICRKDCVRKCEGGHEYPQHLCHQKCPRCKVRVERVMNPCSHKQWMLCCEVPNELDCLALCENFCDAQTHQCKKLCYQHCDRKCQVQVIKEIPNCGHKQRMLCWQNPLQFQCKFQVDKEIPSCGHMQEMACCQDPNEFDCKFQCERSCKNGHPYTAPCHEDPNEFKCKARCERLCDAKSHKCKKLCYQQCDRKCQAQVTKEIPNCGHMQHMLCWQDPLYAQLRCKFQVEREIPRCGHTQQMACWQDPNEFDCKFQCERSCENGHLYMALCHEDPNAFKCNVRCERLCDAQTHQCKKLCYQQCDCKCQAQVTREIPKCGHRQRMFCWQDSLQLKCKFQVERKIPRCGHMQEMACWQDPNEFACKVQCKRSCKNGHPYTAPCHEDRNEFKCKVQVTVELPKCGHIQHMMCWQDPLTFKCNVLVTRKLPKCGHVQEMACCYGPDKNPQYICTKPCEKKQDCGHPCPKTCGESCSGCTVEVEVPLECGHTVITQCCRRKVASYHKCWKTVEIPLSCGHQQRVICCKSEFYSKVSLPCSHKCEKTLSCGHSCNELCSEPCTSKCQELVRRRWPCGHNFPRKCFETQDLNSYPCRKKCRRKLPCGHKLKMRMECGEPYNKSCQAKMVRTYPCGHLMKVACSSTPETVPCDETCSQELLCGHKCSGKCGDCYKSRLHEPCPYDVKLSQSCGHVVCVPCQGLSINSCRKDFTASCAPAHNANKRKVKCPALPAPCSQPCEWNCPHHHCSKQCHEICDRPPCNKPCENLLVCGHKCASVCGEPCIRICPDCDPEKFKEKLQGSARPRGKKKGLKKDLRKEIYIQLDCKHIFPVEFLDQYMEAKVMSDVKVAPKQCPACHVNIRTNCRYGNTTKRCLEEVCKVREIVEEYTHVSDDQKEEIRLMLQSAVAQDTATVHRIIQLLLKLPETITPEVMCYAQCIMNTLMIANAIERYTCTLPLTGIERSKALIHKFVSFTVNFASKVDIGTQRKSLCSLSPQLLEDVRSEQHRVCLTAQLQVVEDLLHCESPEIVDKPRAQKAVISTECYLKSHNENHLQRVSDADYESYSTLLSQVYLSNLASVCKELHDLHPPPLVKGEWFKCREGHYYCRPPRTPEYHCPHCK